MKKVYLLVVAVIVSFVLLQSAEAYSRGGGRSFASAPHFSAPVHHYSAPSRSFSSASARYSAGPRFSSMNRSYFAMRPRFSQTTMALRNPTYFSRSRQFAGDRTAAFNSRTFSRSNAGLSAGNRTFANRSQGFTRERVVARYSGNWQRNWDRSRDHWWRGHRCHFRNGFWFIYDPWPFYPYGYEYGYGLYPYAYYDGAYDDNGAYAADEYATAPDSSRSEYDGDAQVSDVQSALAREGYYDGAIDGNLGPGTRNALRRYQRDHGLDATGGITRGVIESLRLR
jgi:Putative peptidoglycan binding domain